MKVNGINIHFLDMFEYLIIYWIYLLEILPNWKKKCFLYFFAYGQRHYRANIKDHFNEKSVRLFCSQIIGTLCDLLDKKLNLFAQEAWIEMVTYLGRALLSGFEHERQKRKKFPLPKNY
uniref:Uncharacterized protein n=1 Tax=Meloidogyne incognita TaxID=6306 RepID=A0A914LPQ6_MELIC